MYAAVIVCFLCLYSYRRELVSRRGSSIPSALTFAAVLPEVKPVSDYGHAKVTENEATLRQHR